MSQLKKEDLVEGEIYKHSNGSICKWGKNDSVCNIVEKFKGLTRFPGGYVNLDFTIATPEQKHWLETCIKEDKFIYYEEAMKTFIPEYVEWIDNIGSGNLGYQTKDCFKKNKIFKTDVELPSYGFQKQNWIKHLEIYANNYKPSTKEAYNAQFVVKEPEFVLPKKWCIKVTDETRNIINKARSEKGYHPIGYRYATSMNYSGNNTVYHTEITFEQFKKYVLKETEELSPLKLAAIEHPHLAKIEFKPFEILSIINNITKEQLDLKKDGYFRSKFSSIHLNNIDNNYSIVSVANQEGNIFEIGDTIISTRSKKRFSQNVSKIKSFKMNVSNDNILVVGDHYYSTGVLISNIEHHLQGQIEVKPEFVLPEKWFIIPHNETRDILVKYRGGNYLGNSSVLRYDPNDQFHPKCWEPISLVSKDYIEITFEQFKKYVLKETEEIVQPVIEETLLEKAKRLYPVGTIYNCAATNLEKISQGLFGLWDNNPNKIICGHGNGLIYYLSEWAKIIGYEPQIGDKFTIPTKAKSWSNENPSDSNTVFVISKIENNIVTFKENQLNSTVLLKNIKIIK